MVSEMWKWRIVHGLVLVFTSVRLRQISIKRQKYGRGAYLSALYSLSNTPVCKEFQYKISNTDVCHTDVNWTHSRPLKPSFHCRTRRFAKYFNTVSETWKWQYYSEYCVHWQCSSIMLFIITHAGPVKNSNSVINTNMGHTDLECVNWQPST